MKKIIATSGMFLALLLFTGCDNDNNDDNPNNGEGGGYEQNDAGTDMDNKTDMNDQDTTDRENGDL